MEIEESAVLEGVWRGSPTPTSAPQSTIIKDYRSAMRSPTRFESRVNNFCIATEIISGISYAFLFCSIHVITLKWNNMIVYVNT